jgi:hypothetical protein
MIGALRLPQFSVLSMDNFSKIEKSGTYLPTIGSLVLVSPFPFYKKLDQEWWRRQI